VPSFRGAARLLPAFALALLAACALSPTAEPQQRQDFLVRLDSAAGGDSAQHKPLPAVSVAPVVVAAPFSERNLVVRQSDFGYAVDPYSEFAANPVSMWTEALRTWLDGHRVFERVLPTGSSADASLTLETTLLEAVIDRRSGQPATSRVTMRFLLIDTGSSYRVLLDRTFDRAEAIQGKGAESEVAALSLAAAHVMRDFADSLPAQVDPASR
jgi:uncharacterized lipoprotein YmbA